jgi:hypothetical protein
LVYQPQASSTFLLEQISHRQLATSTFLSEQTNITHQPPAKRTGWVLGTVEADDVAIRRSQMSGLVGAHKKFVARQKSAVSPWKRLSERAVTTLHEELPITPTWRAKCQMVRSRQPTGSQSMWFSCLAGRSGAKNAIVMLV